MDTKPKEQSLLDIMLEAVDRMAQVRPENPSMILVSHREYAAMSALDGGPSLENYARIHGVTL